MGLKAIKNSKVENMISALDNLEKMQTDIGYENSHSEELHELRLRLQDKHFRYKELLIDIEAQIREFDNLYKEIRIKYLPEILKELKDLLSEDSQDFMVLRDIIQRTYRN